MTVNSLVLIAAIIYWNTTSPIVWKYFLLGFVGSIFDTVGKVCSTSALSFGPGGPTNAMVEMAGPYLTVVVALISWKMIKPTELVALLFCVQGSLFLVIPETMKMLWTCKCRKGRIPMSESFLSQTGAAETKGKIYERN